MARIRLSRVLVFLVLAQPQLTCSARLGRLHQKVAASSAEVPQRFRQRLENFEEVQYHGSLKLGDQNIRAIYDTGSFDILVVSTKCAQCPNPIYNSSASTTFRAAGGDDIVEHTFGSGPTESTLGFETVQIGPLVARNQTIHEILRHNMSVLDSASFDAIVGIGPQGDNEGLDVPSLQQNLHVAEYSVCLERTPGSPGWLTWGGDLTPEQRAAAVELRLVGRHHWAVTMRNLMPVMELSDKRKEAAHTLLCGKGCAVILDSGTSLISGPSHSLQGLSYLLPKLNENCSNFGDLPDLEFELSGQKMLLPPEAYVFRMRGSPEEKRQAADSLISSPDTVTKETCYYGFMPMDSHTDYGPLWVFGMPFFRHFHATFKIAEKMEDRRIWLARASPTCDPLPLEAEDTGAKNATYEGIGVYPKVVVAQRGQTRRPTRPRSIKASAVLRRKIVAVAAI